MNASLSNRNLNYFYKKLDFKEKDLFFHKKDEYNENNKKN